MNEMDRYFDDLLDRVCTPGNDDLIVLKTSEGEEVAFLQVALIPYESKLYIILKPKEPVEGLEEDEALLFLVNEEARCFELVLDEGLINTVFDIYDRISSSDEQ